MGYTGIIPQNMARLMDEEERKKLGAAYATTEERAIKTDIENERDLQDGVARLLGIQGVTFNQSRMDRRSTCRVGWPDFTFALAGRACCFECKHNGELTPEQDEVCARLVAEGWLVATIRSMEQARDVLRVWRAKIVRDKTFP